MKIVIEVSGGVVTCIEASEDCEIYLVDHDNIKEKGEDTTYAREAYSPDFIGTEEEIMQRLSDTLEEYE
jgi:hypothetical protein